MKKRLCMFLAMLLILMMVTPAFAASAAPNEDEYTFAVEQENGLTICMAVVVENGIPRQLTKAEYLEIKEKTKANALEANNNDSVKFEKTARYETNAAWRGFSYSFAPSSKEIVTDYTLARRISQIFKNADTISVTATTSYTRSVTESGGLTMTSNALAALDAGVKAEYSFVKTATSSTSTSVVGVLRPAGIKPYAAVIFTPNLAKVQGVMTEYLSAMGSSGVYARYNCTVTYANMVGGNWDGIYECAESYTGVSSDFPPPA